MSKHATITIASPEQAAEKLAEMAKVMTNLRYWTEYWKKVYGQRARREKEHWEKRADILLDELGLDSHRQTTFRMAPRIEIENQ